MKRLKKNKTIIDMDVVVVLNRGIQDPEIAADTSVVIEKRKMKKKHQLTDTELNQYKDFVTSAASTICDNGFKIISQKQSRRSYSYYIEFEPEKTLPVELHVTFRLSDHNKGEDNISVSDGKHEDNNKSTKPKVSIFRNFILDGVQKDSIYQVLTAIAEECISIRDGNYSNK